MSGDLLAADGVRLRRATLADVPYLAALGAHADVAATLSPISPWEQAALRATIAGSSGEPDAEGRFVLEAERDGVWTRAGGVAFAVQNRRSRIAYLFGLMVDPAFRGCGLGAQAARALAVHLVRDLRIHRVQLEAYAFNEPALRLFAAAGFVREGVKRKAYWRNDVWNDAVMFALVEEDLAG